jgi:hypothetical protein
MSSSVRGPLRSLQLLGAPLAKGLHSGAAGRVRCFGFETLVLNAPWKSALPRPLERASVDAERGCEGPVNKLETKAEPLCQFCVS